jgi:hypothetical protein
MSRGELANGCGLDLSAAGAVAESRRELVLAIEKRTPEVAVCARVRAESAQCRISGSKGRLRL